MEKLCIKIISRYLSIQPGFEWNGIPNFAIITGVNGVGKTHLLRALNGDISVDLSCKTENSTPYKLVLASSRKAKLDINGLIEYKNKELDRLVKERELEQSLNNYQGWLKNDYSQLEIITDQVQKEKLNRQITQRKASIKSTLQAINDLYIYDYEEELKSVSSISGKNLKDITDADIREYANPYFNSLSEVKEFEDYLKQEELERNERYIKLAKEGRENEIAKVRQSLRSYEKINQLFEKFNFDYFKMLDPFPSDKIRNGEIRFQGKNGEIVEYSALSSGEQMIVKFIIWAMGRDIRGKRINTMLLDEPDAHLHPTMCKMMINILEEISRDKDNGGSGIRVILTTHSPSTIAFAPEDSLYVMTKDECFNRHIEKTTTENAMQILSDGIFTFDKAIYQISLAVNSSKKNILFVEGKTDVNHLNHAIKILDYNLDLDIVDMHDAGTLASFIKSTPAKLFNNKKLIALFDCDDEGKKAYKSINGTDHCSCNIKKLTAIQCEGNSYALLIQSPQKMEKYCPIEFLYPFDYLKSKGMLNKRNYNEYRESFKATSLEEEKILIEEYEKESYLRPYKINDDLKSRFSVEVLKETDVTLFANFRNTIDAILHIIS